MCRPLVPACSRDFRRLLLTSYVHRRTFGESAMTTCLSDVLAERPNVAVGGLKGLRGAPSAPPAAPAVEAILRDVRASFRAEAARPQPVRDVLAGRPLSGERVEVAM